MPQVFSHLGFSAKENRSGSAVAADLVDCVF